MTKGAVVPVLRIYKGRVAMQDFFTSAREANKKFNCVHFNVINQSVLPNLTLT